MIGFVSSAYKSEHVSIICRHIETRRRPHSSIYTFKVTNSITLLKFPVKVLSSGWLPTGHHTRWSCSISTINTIKDRIWVISRRVGIISESFFCHRAWGEKLTKANLQFDNVTIKSYQNATVRLTLSLFGRVSTNASWFRDLCVCHVPWYFRLFHVKVDENLKICEDSLYEHSEKCNTLIWLVPQPGQQVCSI